MEQKGLIYEAIASIMEETKAIGKTEKNQQQGFLFRGIDNVMNELHALFAKHKVFILPEVKDFNVSEKVTEKDYNGQKRTSILYYTRATIKFDFMTTDGSSVSTVNVGEAMDSGDKGMNKAMSVALKYALMQMLLIPTAEDKDPDRTTPPETRPQTISEFIETLDKVRDTDLIRGLQQVVSAKTLNELADVWKNHEELQKVPAFSNCVSARKKQLS